MVLRNIAILLALISASVASGADDIVIPASLQQEEPAYAPTTAPALSRYVDPQKIKFCPTLDFHATDKQGNEESIKWNDKTHTYVVKGQVLVMELGYPGAKAECANSYDPKCSYQISVGQDRDTIPGRVSASGMQEWAECQISSTTEGISVVYSQTLSNGIGNDYIKQYRVAINQAFDGSIDVSADDGQGNFANGAINYRPATVIGPGGSN